MKTSLLFICILIICFLAIGSAQQYEIDARNVMSEIISGHLMMGDPGPEGKQITVNNKYLLFNGSPILPVMGEFHFSRFNHNKWEEILLKMKASGINIISIYIFWIHHEEEKGVFNWRGNNDLRSFVLLCQKHGLWVYPRIGPWCHGEVRNGGLPDWIMKDTSIVVRTNDPGYQFYAERWYKEIASQLNGLFYKDNGPIIGLQLENEYWRGKKGEEHILWLKNTAKKYGMDTPLYTVTGWRNASVPKNEVIPLWGGYPAAPWNTNLNKIENNTSFIFDKPVNDQSIGHKVAHDKYKPDYLLYPFFTCELGVGNQISEHRRPVINPLDGLAIVTASIASGSNLPGYYVFAGGLNPVGKFSTLEEDRLESGYWNEYPDISYDFQAAIRETGEIAPSYHKLKTLHYFLNQFGPELATMTPVVPENNGKTDDLQYAFRCNDNSGFLFVSNYYRSHTKTEKTDVQFVLKLKNEELTLPAKPVNIKDSTIFIWPVNLTLDQIHLKYSTAQLICQLNNGDKIDWYFSETSGIPSEFLFLPDNIKTISVDQKPIEKSGTGYFIQQVKTGIEYPIVVRSTNNRTYRIFILSKGQANQFWFFKNAGNSCAFLSGANLLMSSNQQLQAFTTQGSYEIVPLNCQLSPEDNIKIKSSGFYGFKKYTVHNPVENIKYNFQPADLSEDAKWLNLTSTDYKDSKKLYHKQFFKDFNIDNTAEIKNARFYLLTGKACSIRINGKWLNQHIAMDTINLLDFTGYLKKGHNKLLLDFPVIQENKAWIGALEIEYYTSEKELIVTDSTWYTVEQYKIPATWDFVRQKMPPLICGTPQQYENIRFTPYRYRVHIDTNQLNNYSNVYLRIDYSGDKAQCRSGKKLIADNFNNATTWSINLSNINTIDNQQLILTLTPFQKNIRIYFDIQPETDRTVIESIRIEPEYSTKFIVSQNK